MKKVCILLILSLLMGLFCGCGEETLTVEDYEWELMWATKTDLDTLENEELSFKNVFMKAENGLITIRDGEGKTYSGVYIERGRNIDGYDYTLTIGGFSGHGTVANTTYHDGEKIPTLPIAITHGNEQYTLQFQPKEP